MDTYSLRINHLTFLGMVRKMFEKRNVWERVVAEPTKPYEHRINIQLFFKDGFDGVDIFQPHELSWLDDFHIAIGSIHPFKDHYELRLNIR